MRKTLLPMIASLALCGTATVALITTNARADQSRHNPVMVAAAQPADPSGSPAMAGTAGAPPEMMRAMAARHALLCKNLYARKAGELAFLEAKLSLTPTQEPLFERWKEASMQIAKQHQNQCETHRSRRLGRRPNVVDRLGLQEDFLKRRLADIEAERPSLTALYESLTPAQQEDFGHRGMTRMAMRMPMMRPRMGDRMGHRMGAHRPRPGMDHGDGNPPPAPPQ